MCKRFHIFTLNIKLSPNQLKIKFSGLFYTLNELTHQLMVYFGDYQKLIVFDGDDSGCIINNPLKILKDFEIPLSPFGYI